MGEAATRLGEGSPGSREEDGEGGEGFHIAQTGRRADLLAEERRAAEQARPSPIYEFPH